MAEQSESVAVVTGGNRGIGLDITKRFIRGGLRVVNISREQPDFKDTNLETFIVDLSGRADTEQVGKQIAAKYDVTTFVHNAGVIRPALLENVNLADFDHLTELHLGSAVTLSQCFVPAMRKSKFGRIVLISSRGVLGLATRSSYAATKAGQIGLVRTWALELGNDGITVNAVAPGPIQTDMFREIVPEGSEQMQRLTDSVPVKRLGTAEDIGRVVEFLCDRKSGFITGQTLYVCGGSSVGSLAL